MYTIAAITPMIVKIEKIDPPRKNTAAAATPRMIIQRFFDLLTGGDVGRRRADRAVDEGEDDEEEHRERQQVRQGEEPVENHDSFFLSRPVISSMRARSSLLGSHSPAATFALTCSGVEAPAITDATAG